MVRIRRKVQSLTNKRTDHELRVDNEYKFIYNIIDRGPGFFDQAFPYIDRKTGNREIAEAIRSCRRDSFTYACMTGRVIEKVIQLLRGNGSRISHY